MHTSVSGPGDEPWSLQNDSMLESLLSFDFTFSETNKQTKQERYLGVEVKCFDRVIPSSVTQS